MDDSEVWWQSVLEHHYEEAHSRANSLFADTVQSADGCLQTATRTPRRVRFRGRQVPAYRFVYCLATRTPAAADEVVRHRCHNRRCINPDHLELGTRADNKHDDWEYWANGIDGWLL
ncbi:HNH endonuclease [Roseicyclus marinus]